MEEYSGIELKQLCRICSTDSDLVHQLMDNNTITEIGEMFKACFHLNVCFFQLFYFI